MRSLGTVVEDFRSNLSRRKFYGKICLTKTFCLALFGSSEENLFIVFRIFYWSNVAGEKPASGSGGKSLNS
jgi:hypothetical protein